MRRRYKDFEALYELLVSKYPYRLVPRLPPKKLNNCKRNLYTLTSVFSIHTRLTILVMIVAVSAAFIEQRRRALKRFLLLVVRHPILARDDITKIFLSAGGQVSKKYYQPSSLILYSVIILLSQTFLPEKILPSQLPLHC